MSNFLKNANLSLEDLEDTSNEVLNRIVGELNNSDTRMSHNSHSSSSGRGHYSYVSGAGQQDVKDGSRKGVVGSDGAAK